MNIGNIIHPSFVAAVTKYNEVCEASNASLRRGGSSSPCWKEQDAMVDAAKAAGWEGKFYVVGDQVVGDHEVPGSQEAFVKWALGKLRAPQRAVATRRCNSGGARHAKGEHTMNIGNIIHPSFVAAVTKYNEVCEASNASLRRGGSSSPCWKEQDAMVDAAKAAGWEGK